MNVNLRKLTGRQDRSNYVWFNQEEVRRHAKTRGQALIIVALMMTVLILFVGLGVDVGNLMARSSKLQSAVDSAVLSGAQKLAGGNTITSTASTKAYQVLEANGVLTSTINAARTTVTFPGPQQISMHAVQHIDTFFMRIIPAWATVDISADATADLNSYAEMNMKPYGQFGVVNELNISVWGKDSWRRGGDAYSPQQWNPSGTIITNPEYAKQPYGYLYRVDVPPGYNSDKVYVEIFDPDSYNKSGDPPALPTPYPCPGPQCGTPTPTPSADQYAYCSPASSTCSAQPGAARYNTALHLGAFSSGRPAFWRVDEMRRVVSDPRGINPSGNEWDDTWGTTTQYTLWHFDPNITSALADPSTLSDQPGGAYLSRYTVGNNAYTDLSWYRPNSAHDGAGSDFSIQLVGAPGSPCPNGNTSGDCFTREDNTGFYFYLYVQGIAGSSENNFDLRAGPPQANYDCSTPCYVNEQYRSGATDWNSGGVTIFAKRAMVLNMDTGDHYPMLFTQLNKNAAGQTLGVRHFDQDCNTGCGANMTYQMQKCVNINTTNLCSTGNCEPCRNTSSDGCFDSVATGYVGDNDAWSAPPDGSHPNGYPDPDPIHIPLEGTSAYNEFFGPNKECSTSWLRLQSDPSYTQDTAVWEMPFIRPRLIK